MKKNKSKPTPDDWIRSHTVRLYDGDPVLMVYYEIYDDLFSEETAQAVAERQYTIHQIIDQIDGPTGDLVFFARHETKATQVGLSYFMYHSVDEEKDWAIIMPHVVAIGDETS